MALTITCSLVYFSTLMIETECSSETFADDRITRHHEYSLRLVTSAVTEHLVFYFLKCYCIMQFYQTLKGKVVPVLN
jgi:hypothetical protein